MEPAPAAVAGRWRGWGRLAGRVGEGLLDALLPPTCLTCREPVMRHGAFCPDCFRELQRIGDPLCDGCGLPFLHAEQGMTVEGMADGGMTDGGRLFCAPCAERPFPFARARAAFVYGEVPKRLILPFKHGDRPDLARPIARAMALAGKDLLAEAGILVPVPLHWRRLLRRRYNQSALLARHLGRLSGRPWLPDGLRRVRGTASLGGLGMVGRLQEVEGAFRVTPRGGRAIAGQRVLLVDDVLTSGATAAACARALLAAGAREVDVLAVARVLPRGSSESMDGWG
ncbi:ComF family protein [Roseomonas gilardii subsp. gilardii]|uniref:ComF family protein n=1 Tax=Roseomonas gilardii TaxID=257708 RepID=UPI001FF7075E|nr:ComF family protein [Roseomonas gilardii]UPG74404.1 ComF family protein [Roseomonas gilardii subsp. gilardii]